MGAYAVFVDAAYLERSGERALNARLRGRIDPTAVAMWAAGLGAGLGPDGRHLRTYWYDGAFEPGHPDYIRQRRYFDSVEDVAGLVLRLGYVVERTPVWQTPVRRALRSCGVELNDFKRYFTFHPERSQKGVDALLTLDLLHLAQKGAYQAAVLVAGDRDFEQVVSTVQSEGARVVVAVPTLADLAPQLRRSADAVTVIEQTALAAFFVHAAQPRDSARASPTVG